MSIDAGNAFDKIKHTSVIKKTQQMRNKTTII